MPGFNYVYIDQKGKKRKGQMEAVDETKVLQSLKNEGFLPVLVTKQNVLNKPAEINFTKPVKPRDLSVFCRQLVSIISSGVSVVNALYMLGEQTENKRLKDAIKDTQLLVEKGETLSDAMRQHPKEFPSILINMVEAGEATGSLENSFERMALHFEKTAKTKSLIRRAMVYPIVVSCISLVVLIVMVIFVIPSFIKLFDDMDVEMPELTMAIIHLSDFLKTNCIYVLLVLLAGIIGIVAYHRTPHGKLLCSTMVLKLPIIGKFAQKSASANYSRTLSTLIGSGIPMVEAVEITAKTMNNELFKQTIIAAKEDVEKGIPLSVQLQASGLFPPMVYHMTKIGEETGNLEEMLLKIADYYEEEVELGTQTLTAAVEPLIIIVLAVVVGIMILCILQPMLSMYDNLEKLYQ